MMFYNPEISNSIPMLASQYQTLLFSVEYLENVSQLRFNFLVRNWYCWMENK